ncbi:hypothetical protein ABKV19_019573 [Rosa sericea]
MANNFGRICLLGEDELALIVNKVSDPADRKSFSEVCKLWYKVESLNRSSLRLLGPDFPRQVLLRFPNLVKFETSHSITLANGCQNLSKIMLNWMGSINVSVLVSLISIAHNLTHLDLGGCIKVSDEALEAIGSSSSISYLNLECCLLVTDRGLGFLGNGSISKTLKTLILNWITSITDVGVSHLQKMHCLEHLSLADCSQPEITDVGGAAISAILTLKKLSLCRLGEVSDRTIVALAQNCPNLEMVDLSGCGITGAGIRAFSGHACLQTIVLRLCEVGASDLEHLVLSCRSLKSILVHHKTLKQILPLMRKRTRRFVKSGLLENMEEVSDLAW